MEDLIHLSTNSSAIVPQLLFFLHYSEVIVQAKASGEARQINRVHSGCAHVTRPHPLKFTAVKENGGDRPIMCIVTPHTWHCYSQSNSKQLFYATRVQRTLATGHGVYAITSKWRAAANQFRTNLSLKAFSPISRAALRTSSGTASFSAWETWNTLCPASKRYGPPFPPSPAVSRPPTEKHHKRT